ncbi:MAG: alpha/beta hydrolase [Bdellovibrionota bacterium]
MSPERSHECWFLPSSKPVRGVVLLTHGLNALPASLDTLARVLAARGFVVFRPSFTGHRGDTREFLRVTPEQWEKDARQFHAEALARAHAQGVPLHLCAYSMSALIYGALPELRFSRRALLAPALALHSWYPAAAFLATAFPWVSFRSRIPEGYSANPRGGFRPVKAMHAFRKKWRGEPDSTPTLIWANLRDELVDAPALKRMVSESAAWEYREVSTEGCQLRERFYHLIVGEPALGAREWARVCGETAEFLLL